MKEIELTRGHKAIVDDEDFDHLNKFKWVSHKNKNYFYAVRKRLSSDSKDLPNNIIMHRVILSFPESIIDHKDRNGLNNQRSNLRLVTLSQNGMNSRPTKNQSSKYKGVNFSKRDKIWISRIMKDGKHITIGRFKKENEIDAAKAYDKKAKELFGEFACLNF